MSDLVKQFETGLHLWLREDGFPRPPLLAKHHDNMITMALMALPAPSIFQAAMRKFMTDLTVKEIIFGVDRYTKPGQGTKYADVLTIFWWQGGREGNHGFRFGVVNYRPPPHTIIEPIDWDNTFWNDIMAQIVADDLARIQQRVEAIRKAGGGDIVDAAVKLVCEAKEQAMHGQKP
jgi:hypothetical protein